MRENQRYPTCYYYNTFFYAKLSSNGIGPYNYKAVRRWSKRAKVKMIEMDKIFIPIHVHGNHWCMACINIMNQQIEYYDSLSGHNQQVLDFLKRYLADEATIFIY